VNRQRRPRRVAIVGTSLDILGGQGIQACRLIEGLDAEDVPVIFVPINPRFPKGFRWVRRLPMVRTVLNQLIYLPSLWRLSSADVVHVFSGSYWSFLLAPVPAMIAGRCFNKRVVLNYHSGEAEDHLSHWGSLVHPWLRLAHELVVPSPYLRMVFAQHGYSARVIHNIVDVTRFQYRERRPLRPRVLSTRNFEAYYRVDLVIQAFARFRREVPDATLTLAGYGSEEGRLRELAAAVGDRSIRFAGRVDPADMPRLYADHDIFVNASVLDNQPVSILEAFASGLPIVSTAVGDIPYMVRNGETGTLASADAGDLAGAITRVWNDPEGARAMARRGKAALSRFTWQTVRENWLDIYSEGTRLDEIVIGAESR
jgi:glycosyltransferase involved in cell wall biosynthesis